MYERVIVKRPLPASGDLSKSLYFREIFENIVPVGHFIQCPPYAKHPEQRVLTFRKKKHARIYPMETKRAVSARKSFFFIPFNFYEGTTPIFPIVGPSPV